MWKALFNHIHNQSLRDIQYAVQSTVVFLVSALVSYKSGFQKNQQAPYFLPLLATLVYADTFGGSLQMFMIVVYNYIPLSIFIYIVQVKFGVGYHDFAAISIIMGFLAFAISYINTNVAVRKLVLVIPAIVFCTLATTPDDLVKDTFIWEFLVQFIEAVIFSSLCSLFFFPRFASLELIDRVNYNISGCSRIVSLSVLAMFSPGSSQGELHVLEGYTILKNLRENQQNIQARLGASALEPTRLLRWLFRREECYAHYSLQQLNELSFEMLAHSSALIHSVRNVSFDKRHAIMANQCGGAFIRAYQEDLGKLVEELCSEKFIPYQNAQDVNDCIKKLKKHSDDCYFMLNEYLKNVSSPTGGQIDPFNGREASILFDKKTDLDLIWDVTANGKDNRLTISYFLFQLSRVIDCLDHHFSEEFKGKMKYDSRKSETPQKFQDYLYGVYKTLILDNWQMKLNSGIRGLVLVGVGMIFVEQPTLADKFELGQWILLAMIMAMGDTLGSTYNLMRNRLLGTMMGSIYGYFVSIAVGTHIMGVIGMLVPYIMLFSLIKRNIDWGYFGSCSISTALIVTLGRPVYLPLADGFALLRIQQNAIGILLALVINYLSLPVLANDLLKMNIANVFENFSNSVLRMRSDVTLLINSYSCKVSNAQAIDPVTDLGSVGNDYKVISCNGDTTIKVLPPMKLSNYTSNFANITLQIQLIREARTELMFLANPFPEVVYQNLQNIELFCVGLLYGADCALDRIDSLAIEHELYGSVIQFIRIFMKDTVLLLKEISVGLIAWSARFKRGVRMKYTADEYLAYLEGNDKLEVDTLPSTLSPESKKEIDVEVGIELNELQEEDEHVNEPKYFSSHSAYMHHLQQLSQRLCYESNKLSMHMFQAVAVSSNDDVHIVKSKLESIYTVNALLYACCHLGKYMTEIGNVIHALTEVEISKHTKPY